MKLFMRGMTLVELMVVVLIVGILASIAVPSYRGYMLRTNRTEGTVALLRVRTAQEKFFLQNNRYATIAELSTAPPGGLGIASPTENGHYTIDFQAQTATSFTARATATGNQATDTSCASFTLNDQGTRGSSPGAVATCWK